MADRYVRPADCVTCEDFPCQDVDSGAYQIPGISLDVEAVSIALISEAVPLNAADHYYARDRLQTGSLFETTTVTAFQDAGANVESLADISSLGVYLTTAVKCAKTAYTMKAATIKACSTLLETEIALFPNVAVLLLMGDAAIKSINYIAKRQGLGRVIPAGSTYKLRGADYRFGEIRALPSYLQAGPSFFIEKSKRQMIAEDIAEALRLAGS